MTRKQVCLVQNGEHCEECAGKHGQEGTAPGKAQGLSRSEETRSMGIPVWKTKRQVGAVPSMVTQLYPALNQERQVGKHFIPA